MEKEIQEGQVSAAFQVYICLWLHMLKFSHLVPNKEENPSGKIMIMQITQILGFQQIWKMTSAYSICR